MTQDMIDGSRLCLVEEDVVRDLQAKLEVTPGGLGTILPQCRSVASTCTTATATLSLVPLSLLGSPEVLSEYGKQLIVYQGRILVGEDLY